MVKGLPFISLPLSRTYCFHAHRPTLSERQEFILKGEAWKTHQVNPLNNLKVAELRKELEKHGLNTENKKKAQLQKEMDDLQKGISNLPAILLTAPQASLESLHLGKYEIFPTEPLHDLKGHIRNLIDEATKKATGETLDILKRVQDTALNKTTLRYSDYRKALILIYNSLQKCTCPNSQIIDLFRTATEISEIMYAPDSKRTPKEILRFHNVTYQHGKLCMDLFAHGPTKNPVFGHYYHSISCHSPLLLRIITLRSVNSEVQERMFGQAKQITRSTSCLRPDHVITNILTRIHAESKSCSNALKIQESEIHKLANVLGPKSNTIIPRMWINSNPSLHQAHLERISDFLLPGPGVWWQYTQDGIEFFDGHDTPSVHPEGPDVHHIRSTSLFDIDMYLHNKWDECCCSQVPLPANHIRQYQSDGLLNCVTTCQRPPSINTCVDSENSLDSDIITPKSSSATLSTVQATNLPEVASQIAPQPTDAPNVCAQDTTTTCSSRVTFRCTLTKTLSQVLPVDATLKQFDQLRSKVKQAKRTRTSAYDHSSRRLVELSQKLKNSLISKMYATIQSWDQKLQQNRDLEGRVKPKHIVEATHKLHLAEKVLKHEWGNSTQLDTSVH